ncbi:hypothetical protein CW751_13685 [Brumimicrobium salinarum]|uniref:Peptidase S74 domain-containing protein n=1 Tax=Brumimicrobium salinarum TaxID=2058658 RepID=A0A2I0QZD3_9FLAO|nr:tail fiber domain-containing protein [Brumimicrobium salinarum]PKR79686.1 hypothetical protein CW751_13685 [Brumimicrobium salinarum]
MQKPNLNLKALIWIFIFIISTAHVTAQNVGINEENPTNTLHIKPLNTGDEPLRIEGLTAVSAGENALLIHNPSVGVVRYITINNLSDSILESLVVNQVFVDSMVSMIYNYGDTLLHNETFLTSLGDSIDTHLDSLTLNGNILNGWVDGNNTSVDLTSLTGVNQNDIINIIYNNGDTLLNNTTFLNNLQDSIDTHLDSLVLNGTLLSGWVDGANNTVDLGNLIGTDNQNLTGATLSGTTLTIDIQNGTSTSVDLSSLIGTDNQDLTNATLSGNILTIDIQNGASVNVDLSSLVGSDSQNLTLTGDNLSISNGNTVMLTSLKDHDWYESGTTNQATSINQSIFTNGDVGIGNNNPLSKLHLSGNPLVMRLENTSGGTWGLNSTNAGDFRLENISGSSTAITALGSNDYVGIGTNNPTHRLEVNGEVLIDNGTNDGARLIFRGGTGATEEYRARVGLTGNLGFFPIEAGLPGYMGEALVLTQDAKVGVGDHQAPLYALELKNQMSLYGQARATGWLTYSDERIKSNRQSIGDAVGTIKKLNPVYYFQHNSEKTENGLAISDKGGYSYGFLAQELYKVVPEMVFKPKNDSDELWSVDYIKLIPILTKAIQEQQLEIDALKTENQQLVEQQNKFEELENEVEELKNQIKTLIENTK